MPRSRSLADLIRENRSASGPPVSSAEFAASQSQPTPVGMSTSTPAPSDEPIGTRVEKKIEKVKKIAALFGGGG